MPLKLAVPAPDGSANLTPEVRPKQVKEWLDSLASGNPTEAGRVACDALASLNRVRLPADQRVKLMELYRPTLLDLTSAIAQSYYGHPLPLAEKSRKAAHLVRELLLELGYGYKLALLDTLSKRVSFSNKGLPLILQRAMDALHQLLQSCYETYSPTPAGVWSEIHQMFRYSLHENIQDAPVSDSPYTATVNLSYKRALLLALADPYKLQPAEIRHTAAYLTRFGDHAHLLPLSENAGAVGHFLVRLDADKPPRAIAHDASSTDSRTDILLNTLELARLVHHHIAQLEGGKTVGALNLPTEGKEIDYVGLLRRLLLSWGIAPKRHFSRLKNEGRVEICVGIRALHCVLGGEIPVKTEEESQEITVQYATSVIDKHSCHTLAPVICSVINESAGGFALSRNERNGTQLRVGDVLGIRQEQSESWNVGVVRWAKSGSAENLELGVQMLAPAALPVQIRPTLASEQTPTELALLIPELPLIRQSATILAPGGVFQPMREYLMEGQSGPQTIRATQLIEHTQSFDLFEFKLS